MVDDMQRRSIVEHIPQEIAVYITVDLVETASI